jgi:hypothetical protein
VESCAWNLLITGVTQEIRILFLLLGSFKLHVAEGLKDRAQSRVHNIRLASVAPNRKIAEAHRNRVMRAVVVASSVTFNVSEDQILKTLRTNLLQETLPQSKQSQGSFLEPQSEQVELKKAAAAPLASTLMDSTWGQSSMG